VNIKLKVFGLKVVGALASFFVVAVITNLMSPSEAGVFFVLFAMQLTLSTFFRFGLDYILIGINADIETTEKLFTSIVIIILFITIIGLGAVFLLSEYVATFFDLPNDSIEVLLLSILPTVLVYVISFLFQGLHQPSLFVFGTTILIPCSLMLTFILFYNELGGVWCIVISAWFSFILMFLMFVQVTGNSIWVKTTFFYTLEVFKKSKNLFGVMVSTVIMEYALVFLLGKYGNFQEVAYYTFSMRMTLLVGFVLTTYNAIYLPKYSRLNHDGEIVNLKLLVKKNTKQMLIIVSPAIILLLCFSENIISLINEEYSIANEVLVILLLSQIVHVGTGPSGMILMMTGFERDNHLSQLLAVFTLIVSGALLVPEFGAIGAAYSYFISIVCSKIISNLYLYKNLGFTSFPNIGACNE